MRHLLILTTVIVVSLMISRPFEQVGHWTGRFDLKVTLVGDPGAPITSIDAYPLESDFELEGFKADKLEGGGSRERITLQPDNSFQVRLRTGGKVSSTGRELSYQQPQYLGVVLTFDHATTRRLWVELPDGRERKDVELKIAPPATTKSR